MNFSEALKPYTNSKSGMISLYPNDGMIDNFHYITAHAIALGERLGEDMTALRVSASNFAFYCSIPNFGLLRRRPDDYGATSFDEYFGAAHSSKITAGECLEYGWKHRYCYNVESPDTFDWRFFFPRNICFLPHMLACRDGKSGLFSQAAWAIGAALSTCTERADTSGKLLIDLQSHEMKGWIAEKAIASFHRDLSKQYSGRRDLYRIYMPKDHPLAEFQREDWT